MLELKNLSFSVNDGNKTKQILKDINLVIDDKKFTVITGPNGGGKSTLAKIIMGIEKPTSGKIFFNGEDITDWDITKRALAGISFAFQQPVRFKGIGVKDLLSLAAGEKLSTSGACTYLYQIHLDTQVAVTSCVIAVISIALATYIYKGEKQPVADMLYRRFPKLHRAAYKRFYMDEVYMFVTHKIIFRLVSTPIAWFDRHVVDGTFDFLAWGANEGGESMRGWQSGDVRHYAVWFLSGAVALTLVLLCI